MSTPNGDIYACDQGSHQILHVPASGTPTIACGAADGSAGFWGEDLPATASALDTPTGLVRDDTNGVLYVADAGNRRIRHFAPGGRIYTMAGGGLDAADTVARASDAALGELHGLAFDTNRNVYFSERDTGRIRRVDPSGHLSTIARLAGGLVGAVAVAATGDRLWIAHEDAVSVVALASPGAGPKIVIVSPGKRITSLAFDQVGTLYFLERDAGAQANGGTVVRAAAVGADGTLVGGTQPSVVAGTSLQSSNGLDYEMVELPCPDARTQALAGGGACSLAIDLHHAASPSILSGALLVGSSFESSDSLIKWGQIARLEPLP